MQEPVVHGAMARLGDQVGDRIGSYLTSTGQALVLWSLGTVLVSLIVWRAEQPKD